jgi:hypothetical protein
MKLLRAFATFLILASLVTPVASAASGDLVLDENGVSFSSDLFLEGTPIRIWASVLNASQFDLLGSVQFKNQYGVLAPDQPISALRGNTDDVFIDWIPPDPGVYHLTMTVIPWEDGADDPSNNVVNRTITVLSDLDRDGIPDDQDEDRDGDGVNNDEDLFPDDSSESTDADGDGAGDNADPDDDNDGTLDEDDAFPNDPIYSSDQDGDGVPDEEDEDRDGDGLSNRDEDRIGSDPDQTDTDQDGTLDGDDAFPTDPTESSDRDGDGIGDNSDDDIDGDGVSNNEDSNPGDAAPSAQTDQNVYLTELGDTVVFDASSSQDDSSIVQYIWQFGDKTLEGPRVTTQFDATGLQTATLTVLDESGQSDTAE